MGLKEVFCSYYGRLGGDKPIRTLGEDLVIERKKQMMEDLKSMEERIKRHITECKREVIKELVAQKLIQQPEAKKELKDGSKGRKSS